MVLKDSEKSQKPKNRKRFLGVESDLWLARIIPIYIIRNDGVGGSSPSCGTSPPKMC